MTYWSIYRKNVHCGMAAGVTPETENACFSQQKVFLLMHHGTSLYCFEDIVLNIQGGPKKISHRTFFPYLH